jgi:hypothetical protein
MPQERAAAQYGSVRRTVRGAQTAAAANLGDDDHDVHDDHHHHNHDHAEPDPVALFVLNTAVIGVIMMVVYYFVERYRSMSAV